MNEKMSISKTVQYRANLLKEDWVDKVLNGFLSKCFGDKIMAMPESIFISTFLEIVPNSPKDIEELIKNNLITGNCYNVTDTEGFNEVWEYQMNEKVYYIELSHWSEMKGVSFERQAAEQIFESYCNDKNH